MLFEERHELKLTSDTVICDLYLRDLPQSAQ